MKYQTAKKLTMLDVNAMTLEQVQRHKVSLNCMYLGILSLNRNSLQCPELLPSK